MGCVTQVQHNRSLVARVALGGRFLFLYSAVLGGVLLENAQAQSLVLPTPAADGWTSEAYAETSQIKLKALLASWLGNSGSPSGLGPWDLTGQLQEQTATNLGEQLSRKIARQAASKPFSRFSDAWAGFANLLPKTAKSSEMAVKVKTVSVDEKQRKTVHLVHLLARVKDEAIELDATWHCQWSPEGELAGLSTSAFAWHGTKQPKPWLVDQTATLLAKCPEAARQLAHGTPHWQLRTPRWAGFFKFGHHGGSVADVNGDGLLDLYVCQDAGVPNRLFLHTPDHQLQDVSAQWGLDLLDATQSALFTDFDGDGDADAALATLGPLAIFENTGQQFIFRLRLPSVTNVYALAAADFDLDGDLDLFAGRYFGGEKEGGSLAIPTPAFDANNGGANFLIRNTGPTPQGFVGWQDATAETGLDENNRRFTYAAVWEDINADGRPDLYVANDYGRNTLHMQEPQADGTWRFRDVAREVGLDQGAFGMSASTADINRDGLPDLHLGAMFSSAGSRITTQEKFISRSGAPAQAEFQRMAAGNQLFLQTTAQGGKLQFQSLSKAAGIAMGRWSWGCNFADLQNDGWPDLFVGNGFVTGQVADDL